MVIEVVVVVVEVVVDVVVVVIEVVVVVVDAHFPQDLEHFLATFLFEQLCFFTNLLHFFFDALSIQGHFLQVFIHCVMSDSSEEHSPFSFSCLQIFFLKVSLQEGLDRNKFSPVLRACFLFLIFPSKKSGWESYKFTKLPDWLRTKGNYISNQSDF